MPPKNYSKCLTKKIMTRELIVRFFIQVFFLFELNFGRAENYKSIEIMKITLKITKYKN